jgi:hypothetical protein
MVFPSKWDNLQCRPRLSEVEIQSQRKRPACGKELTNELNSRGPLRERPIVDIQSRVLEFSDEGLTNAHVVLAKGLAV